MGEVLPDLGEVPGEKLQGHEQAWQRNGVAKVKEVDPGGRWIKTKSSAQSAGERARSLPTLAFVLDLLRGDDFVEDGSERLVFSDDSGRDERGHDELPLTDVRFHGDSGREATGGRGF